MIDEFQQPIRTPETSSILREKNNPQFITQWILACAIGYALGMSISVVAGENIGFSLWLTIVKVLGMPQELSNYDYMFASALMGGVLGGIISFSQWIVLRRYIRNSLWWVLVGTICNAGNITLNSIAYTVISYKVANLSPYDFRFKVSMLILAVFTAVVTGFLEWLILRNKFLNSIWWIGIRIIVNEIALILSILIGNIDASLSLWFGRFTINILLGLICGVLVGAISGLTLYSFSNNKRQTSLE